MIAPLTHAGTTLRVACSPGNRLRAGVLVLSGGFGLFLTSAALTDQAMGIVVLVLALTLSIVPLWRGILWSSGSPSALPMGARGRGIIEAITFGALTLVPATALLGVLFTVAADLSELGAFVGQLGLTAAIVLPAAALASLVRPRQVPLAVWVLVALPGIGGTLLGVGIATDGPAVLLELTVLALGIALVGGTLHGTLWLARRLSRHLSPGSASWRQGRTDRLYADTRRQLLLSIPLVVACTAAAWMILAAWESRAAGTGVYQLPGTWTWLEGLLMVLPALPRVVALTGQLGVSLQLSSEQPGAWDLLPVEPRRLRVSLALLTLGPLAAGALTDLVMVGLHASPLAWFGEMLEITLVVTGIVAGLSLLMVGRIRR